MRPSTRERRLSAVEFGTVLWLAEAAPALAVVDALASRGLRLQMVRTLAEVKDLLAASAESSEAAGASAAALARRVLAAVVVDPEERGAAALWPRLVVLAPRLPLVAAAALELSPATQRLLAAGFEGLAQLDCGQADSLAANIERVCRRSRRAADERRQLALLRQFHEQYLKSFLDAELRALYPPEELLAAGLPEVEPSSLIVVEDEELLRELYQSLLARPPHDLRTAVDAEEAWRLVSSKPVDLLITDKNLPGMNGLELVRRVKLARPETAAVVITGYGSKEAAIEALELGVEAFIEKPFDIDALEQLVVRLLAKQQARKKKALFLQALKERHADLLARYSALAAGGGVLE